MQNKLRIKFNHFDFAQHTHTIIQAMPKNKNAQQKILHTHTHTDKKNTISAAAV